MPVASINGNGQGHLPQLPIIDISKSDRDTQAKLIDAAATYGFVYIKSTGLEFSREIMDQIFDLVCSVLSFPYFYHQLMSVVITWILQVAAQ